MYQKNLLTQVDSVWSDMCLSCRCTLERNTNAIVYCTRECPGPVDLLDYEFNVSSDHGACCPGYSKTACKDGKIIHKVILRLQVEFFI